MYKIDNQQGPTAQHRKYIQYLIITYNGRESEKEWIYVYVKLNHFAVHLKHCKSTAAAAAKSLQSCPTLCDPIDGSSLGSSIPGILQAKNTGVGCHFLLHVNQLNFNTNFFNIYVYLNHFAVYLKHYKSKFFNKKNFQSQIHKSRKPGNENIKILSEFILNFDKGVFHESHSLYF